MRPRIGVIGTGASGRRHLRALAEGEHAEVVAICDAHEPSLEEAKRLAPHAEAFRDYRQLLDRSEVDAVIVAVPNHLHRQVVVDALEAGKHVLCEKPLAPTIEDCRAMLEAERRSGRLLQVGFVMRFNPAIQRAKELLSQGRVGEARLMWCMELRPPFRKKVGDWVLRRELSGGSLVEKNCHHFDLFNWFCGRRPLRVFAFGGADVVYKGGGTERALKEPDTEANVVDNAWAVVEYEEGVRAGLCLSLFLPEGLHTLELGVVGERGILRCRPHRFEVEVREEGNPHGETIRAPASESTFYLEQLHFVECIREGRKPLADSEAGMMAVAVALAAERAVEEGRVVEISEIL